MSWPPPWSQPLAQSPPLPRNLPPPWSLPKLIIVIFQYVIVGRRPTWGGPALESAQAHHSNFSICDCWPKANLGGGGGCPLIELISKIRRGGSNWVLLNGNYFIGIKQISLSASFTFPPKNPTVALKQASMVRRVKLLPRRNAGLYQKTGLALQSGLWVSPPSRKMPTN